jgi:hypothetical protein
LLGKRRRREQKDDTREQKPKTNKRHLNAPSMPRNLVSCQNPAPQIARPMKTALHLTDAF